MIENIKITKSKELYYPSVVPIIEITKKPMMPGDVWNNCTAKWGRSCNLSYSGIKEIVKRYQSVVRSDASVCKKISID